MQTLPEQMCHESNSAATNSHRCSMIMACRLRKPRHLLMAVCLLAPHVCVSELLLCCRGWLQLSGFRESLQQQFPNQNPRMDVVNGEEWAFITKHNQHAHRLTA